MSGDTGHRNRGMVTTVALYTAQTVVVEGVELVQARIAIFFSTGLVPLNSYPGWIQPFVAHQPVSYAIAAMRGLQWVVGPLSDDRDAGVDRGYLRRMRRTLGRGYRRASTH